MIFGKDINYSITRFAENYEQLVQSFDCGNEVINDYLKNKANSDTQATTFIITDNDNKRVICYYSLSCSGFVITSSGKFIIYPAVEIKMFAIDSKYQHMRYSEDIEEGNLSDLLFSSVIADIYNFTEEYCGADKVILYSVPDAENFYKRNGFNRFERYMLKSTSLFTDGCIPMYMSL